MWLIWCWLILFRSLQTFVYWLYIPVLGRTDHQELQTSTQCGSDCFWRNNMFVFFNLFTRSLIFEIIPGKYSAATKGWINNRTKQFDETFCSCKVSGGSFAVRYIQTELMNAESLTKATIHSRLSSWFSMMESYLMGNVRSIKSSYESSISFYYYFITSASCRYWCNLYLFWLYNYGVF